MVFRLPEAEGREGVGQQFVTIRNEFQNNSEAVPVREAESGTPAVEIRSGPRLKRRLRSGAGNKEYGNPAFRELSRGFRT